MGQTTTEDREIGSFPRGATALLGLLNYVTTRVGGAKQEEGVCAPAPDEPAPEESADEDRVAAMPDTPKIAKPSREQLALRAKQADRKKAFAARRCVYAGHRHMHLRWWRETDSWRSFESTRDGFVSTAERLEVREAREARFYEVIPQPPPPTEAPPQPTDGTTTDQEWVQLRRAARRAAVEAAVRERRESARKEDRHAEDQASRVAQELIHEEEEQQGRSAALAVPRSASSGRLRRL